MGFPVRFNMVILRSYGFLALEINGKKFHLERVKGEESLRQCSFFIHHCNLIMTL